jgi:serine/threonine protein kinase
MNTTPERSQRALAMFDELIDLDDQERARRLRSCADRELAVAVSRMLDADATSGVFDGGVAAVMPTLIEELADPGSVDETAPALDGHRIGIFEVQHLLGRGGMGEVYLADRQVGDVRQRVALKLLKRGMDSDELNRRFNRERRILAQLNHPHIARFIDSGVSDDGRPYYAMEYVQGKSLTAFAIGIGMRERIELMIRVCEAVAYAHARLIVHRDLKPSNVMVDAEAQPRILDFGIAKVLGDDDQESTATGLRAMSPQYAAPEQILGEPIGVAADVYALGVLLYELLTGVLPHRRDAQTLEGLVQALSAETVTAPSVTLRRAGSTQQSGRVSPIDGDLDLIVLQATKREPERRYVSASNLADDLRRWLANQPISARPDTLNYRLRKFVRRHRGGVLAATLTTLAILSVLGIALWQANLAREQARRADAEARHATTVRNFFAQMLERADPALQPAGSELRFKDWVQVALQHAQSDLDDAPLERAEISASLGRVLNGLGDHHGAIEAFERSLEDLNRFAGTHHEERSETLQYLATALTDIGEPDRSDALLAQSLAEIDKLPLSENTRNGRIGIRTTMLRNANRRGAYLDALRLGQANLDDRMALYGSEAYQLAVDYNNLGATLSLLGRARESEAAYVRTNALLDRDPRTPESRRAYVQNGLAGALLDQGRNAEALAAVKNSLHIAERTLGAEHPFNSSAFNLMSLIAFYQGDLKSAKAHSATAIETTVRNQIAIPPVYLLNQIRFALAQGDFPSALDRFEALEQAMRKTPPVDNLLDRGQVMVGLAQASLGEFDDSRKLSAAAISRLQENVHASPLHLAEAAAYYAQTLALAGDAQASLIWRQRAMEILTRRMDSEVAAERIERWQVPGELLSP